MTERGRRANGAARAASARVTPHRSRNASGSTLSRQSSTQSLAKERPTFQSIARRVRMGKKVERLLRDKLPASEEDGAKSPEPYQCCGNFMTDYAELCRQNNLERPPTVLPRPRRPASPPQAAPECSAHGASKKGREDKKAQQQQQQQAVEEEETAEERELIALFGFKPRSFVAKETGEYMRPSVQVDLEQPDKYETVTDIYVRGWKVDSPMLDSFRQCFATLQKLHSLHFWRAAFDSERIQELSEILPQCDNIKMLHIDANEALREEVFHELIGEGSHLTKLQLRFCGISAAGCCKIAQRLGNVRSANTTLLSLDLSGNKIGDVGAVAIAKALRTNRTLLHLSLNNNGISDVGCSEIAKSLSQFILTHEEIVCRRYLLSERDSAERAKSVSPQLSRRDHGRPGSVRSADKGRASREGKRANKGAKDAKEEKGKGKKDDKPSGKKDEALDGPGRRRTSMLPGGSSAAPRRMSVAVTDSAKGKGKAKGGKAKAGSAHSDQHEVTNEAPETRNPLLERVEAVSPGELRIPGNFVLILLNLARNKITEKGLEDLLTAVTFQSSYLSQNKVNGTGLMKILTKGNLFPEEDLRRLEEVMLVRDPFYKAPPKTPESDSIAS